MFEFNYNSNFNIYDESKCEIPEVDAGVVVKKRLEELILAADRTINLINPQEHINLKAITPSCWNVLDRALHNDQELSERVLNVLDTAKSSMESPSQQCRQLSDLASCLSLLSYRMQGEGVTEQDQKLLKELVMEIDKVTSRFFQATTPRWTSHLDKLAGVIRDSLQGQKKNSTTPSLLNTHQGTPIDDKTFGHIHAEGIIGGSSLEGSPDGPILAYLKKFLMAYESNFLVKDLKSENLAKELPSLIKMFGDASNLVGVAKLDSPISSDPYIFKKEFPARLKVFQDSLVKVVEDLKKGERTLVPSGWAGAPSGHSMKLGIERDQEGRLNVFLYNSGDGLQNHASLTEGGDVYYQQFIVAKNVDSKRLVDPIFTQALFELLVIPRIPDAGGASEYGPKDLYALIREGLDAQIVTCEGEREQFKMGQTSGICAWASVLAVLHRVLGPKDYHRLNCDLTFDSLCAYAQSVRAVLPTDEEKRRLLQHAAVHCAQITLDAYSNGAISLEYLQSIHSTLKELDFLLEAARGEAHHHMIPQDSLDFTCVERSIPLPYLFRTWEQVGVENQSDPKALPASASPPRIAFSFEWVKEPSQISEGLSRLGQHVRNCFLMGSSSQGIECLDQFFSLLAVEGNEKLWKQIPAEQRAQTMVGLADLSETLFDAANMRPANIRSYTTYACYVNALMLLLGGDHPDVNLSQGGVAYYAFLTTVSATPAKGGLVDDQNLYYAEERVLRHRALEIFMEQPSEGRHLYLSLESDRGRVSSTPISAPSNGYQEYELRYIDELLARDPSIKEKLEARYPHYKAELASTHWQVALALCDWYGEILPPAFCAARRQALIASSLLRGKIILKKEGEIFQSEIISSSEHTPELKFTHAPIKVDPQLRDFKSNERFKELTDIRTRQNRSKKFCASEEGSYAKGYDSEADVMLRPLDEWQRGLQLILTQGDLNEQDPHFEQQVTKTLAYFSDHIEELGDHDKRMLCRLLVFEGNYLEKLLQDNPAFVKVLSQFVNRGLEHYIERNDVETAMFFVEMGRALDGIAKHRNIQMPLPNFRSQLKGILQRGGWTAEQRTLLHQQLVASYFSHPPDVFTSDDAAMLAAGLLHNRVYPLVNAKATDGLRDEMRKAQGRWQEPLATVMRGEAGAKVANSILRSLDLQVGKMQWDFSKYPWCVSADGIYAFNTESMQFLKDNNSLTGLPAEIRQNEDFKRLFTKTNYPAKFLGGSQYEFIDERGIITRTGPIRQKLNGSWYQLSKIWNLESLRGDNLPKDFIKLCEQSSVWIPIEKGTELHILVKNADFRVTHEIVLKEPSLPMLTPEEKQRFYRFLLDKEHAPASQKILSMNNSIRILTRCLDLTAEESQKLTQSKSLAKPKKSFWDDEDEEEELPKESAVMKASPPKFEMELVELLQQIPQYSSSLLVQACVRVVDEKTSWTLVDLKHAPQTPLKNLFGEGMLWRDDQDNFTELELPSLELTFKMVRDDGGAWRADSVKYPGYHLASNQFYRGLEAIHGAVVLENEVGKRKLILPYGDISASKKGSLSSSLSIWIDPKASKRSIAIDLDAVSKPAPSTREQQLYLANILLVQKQYVQVQALLRSSFSHIIPYSNQELERLEAITQFPLASNDQSPQATAVACTAMALMASSPDHRPPLDPDAQNRIKTKLVELATRFKSYQQQRGSIPDLILSQEEEINSLTYLLQTIGKYAGPEDLSIIFTIASWLSAVDRPAQESSLATMPDLSIPSKQRRSDFSFYTLVESLTKYVRPDEIPFLITRPGSKFVQKFFQLYEMALSDPVKLEVYLAGAQNDPKVPLALIELLRAVAKSASQDSDDFPPTLSDVKAIIYEKDQETFNDLLAKAKVINSSLVAPASVALKGSLPMKHPRKMGAQAISMRPEMPVAIAAAPLPPRIPVLSTKQLIEAFDDTPNGGLKLSEEEIEQLLVVIGAKGLSGTAAELGKHIETYWTLPQHQAPWHLLGGERVVKTKTLLQVAHAEMGKKANLLEQELLSMANELPIEERDALIFEMEKGGHVRQEVTLRDLILFTARSQHLSFIEKNPALVAKEKELLGRCLVYLDAKAQQQQVSRALSLLKSLEPLDSESAAYARISEQCYQELTRVLPYSADQNPENLVFEVLEGLGLRDWQVADLQRMLTPKPGENSNVILEKVMGSGKTKVYLPLLALNKADGDHLSIIVVDAAQYPVVASAMQVTAGQTFAQVAHTLQFSRDSDTSAPALKKILAECHTIRQQRHFLVVTDKTMHSLFLARDQLWDDYLNGQGDQANLVERINLMREITNLFKQKGRATLDEADLLLNCRFEVVYSLGDPQPINPAHTEIVADLYEAIAPVIAQLVPFSRTEYERLKPELIKAFVEKVVKKKMPHCNPAAVTAYFQGDWASGELGAKFVDKYPDITRRQLAIVRYEILELLPIVLDKRCGEHFGYSDRPDQILAVPYVASGTPSPTSEFAFPYALVDYTIQTLQTQGVSTSLLKKIITKMQNSAAKEQADDRGLLLQETQGFKDFQELLGGKLDLPFLGLKDGDIIKLAETYRDNPPDLYAFAKKFLLPAVMMHGRKLSSTPYTLVNMFLEVQGFTGTPWNSSTYAKALQTIRDLYSAGKTTGIIWKNSQAVHPLQTTRFKEMIDEIAVLHAKGDYNALMDVGAIFNGVDNQTVAQELLKTLPPKIEGVLFFLDNRPVVIDRKGAIVPFEEGQSTRNLYIYYDQLNTTGKDFKITNKSLITFDKNTNMRDLDQGYMRDRQAENAPRVEFLLSKDAREFIIKEQKLPADATVGTAEILRCAQLNLDRQLDEQIVMATFGMIKEVAANHLRSLLDNPDIPPPVIKDKAQSIRHLIGEMEADDPYQQLGRYQEDISSKIFFEGIVEQTIDSLRPLLGDKELCPVGLTEAILRQQLQACMDLTLLPETMPSAPNSSPNQLIEQQSQNEVQQQQQQMAMVQKELMSDVEKTTRAGTIHWNWDTTHKVSDRAFYRLVPPKHLKREELPVLKVLNGMNTPLANSQAPFLSLKKALTAEPTLHEFADIFDIQASYNFLPMEGHTLNDSGISEVHNTPFERQQLLVQHMLICKDRAKGKTQVRLISNADFGFFYEQLGKERSEGKAREVEVTLYHLSLKVVQSNSSAIVSGAKDPVDSEVRRQIVQAKFFNGESSYNREEQKLLKAWIAEKGSERMRRLFEEHILKYKEDKRKEYNNSILHTLLFQKK